jgi:hypothetical protein
MASKRMFSLNIVDSDAFLDMPVSSQLLYFHLGMRADDDGFIGNAKKITKICNCSVDDLSVLIGKGFLIPFNDGVVVIKHWRMNNNKPDLAHYKPTTYQEDYQSLYLKENKSYTINPDEGIALNGSVKLFADVNGAVNETCIAENRKKFD